MSEYLSAIGVTQWIPRDYLEAPVADFVNRKVYVRSSDEQSSGRRLVILLSDPEQHFSPRLFDDVKLALEGFDSVYQLSVACVEPTAEWSQEIKIRKADKVLVFTGQDLPAPFQDAIDLGSYHALTQNAGNKRHFYNAITQSVLDPSS